MITRNIHLYWLHLRIKCSYHSYFSTYVTTYVSTQWRRKKPAVTFLQFFFKDFKSRLREVRRVCCWLMRQIESLYLCLSACFSVYHSFYIFNLLKTYFFVAIFIYFSCTVCKRNLLLLWNVCTRCHWMELELMSRTNFVK